MRVLFGQASSDVSKCGLVKPIDVIQLLHMKTPHVEPCMRSTNDNTHAFGMGVEFRVAEQASQECGGLEVLNVEKDQAVSCVAEVTLVEIAIKRDEGWLVFSSTMFTPGPARTRTHRHV